MARQARAATPALASAPLRTALVVTNRRCNQACTYCTSRAAADDLASIQPGALADGVDRALAAGSREIVFGGGEPTLHRALEDLVARARAGGADVVLATNATLIDAPRARALRAAGLERARVNLAGWGAALDRVTRDPGGFGRTVAGVEALAAAGVPVEIEAAAVRSTASMIPALPARLRAAFGDAVHGLRLAVPVESPAPGELLSVDEAAATLRAVADAARAGGLPAKLVPDAAPPPCALPDLARHAGLYALSPGAAARARARPGHRRLEACAGCLAADACPGMADAYLGRFGLPPIEPVRDARLRRRLATAGTVEAQVERELVTRNQARGLGRAHLEDVVRVLFRCNQACRFCFVSTHLPDPDEARVRAAISDAARAGRAVALSGGEPTLHPRLAELVALARAGGAPYVTLQTNATRLAEPGAARALREAGLEHAFVSLHASRADVSDAITGVPGSFERTCAGIDALAAEGIRLELSFVLSRPNAGELAPVVRLAAARWPGAAVTLSFVTVSPDVVPRAQDLLPRYSEVLPAIAEGVAEARRLGVALGGYEAMSGLPLCLVPGSPERFLALPAVPEGLDGGEFADAEPCRGCDLRGRCHGVRRSYAELHGTDELRPFVAAGRR